MKVQLLPSTFDENGRVSLRQHLTCFVIDDLIAFDAGSLAMGCTDRHKQTIRDIVISHAHLDHIAGLPLFIDDLFARIEEPVRIHAIPQVIEALERDVFNWTIYPRFSELQNKYGAVMRYIPFAPESSFRVGHLRIRSVDVNHKVPGTGFVITDDNASIGITGDTAELGGFWDVVNNVDELSAVLIECAFPNELAGLAADSHHLTPSGLEREIEKIERDCPIYIINIKPMYRETTIRQIMDLRVDRLQILEVGKVYHF